MQEWILEITFVCDTDEVNWERVVIKATDVYNAMVQSCHEVNTCEKKHPNAQIERMDLTLFSA